MDNSRFSNTMWTYFEVDDDLKFLEISNLDERLFFGRHPIAGQSIIRAAGQENRIQASIIFQEIYKARELERNSCFTYFSEYEPGKNLPVCVHLEFHDDGSVRLYLTALHTDELHLFRKTGSSKPELSFQAVYDKLPVGVAIYSRSGLLLYANEASYRISGIDPDVFFSTTATINSSLFFPDAVKEAVHKGVSVKVTFPYNFKEVVQQEKDRADCACIRQLECKGEPIFNDNGEYDVYLCIMDDITEKLQNEEMLRQSRQKTEIAMRTAEIMLWEFDVQAKLFYSDNEPMNGYDQSKPLTMEQYIETVHPDNREKVTDIMRRMLAGEDFSFDFETYVLFPDNQGWQFCSINGSPYERKEGRVVRYVGTRKNNTLLHQRKLLQDKILNSIPLSILIKDVENDYRYVFCNDESKHLFGTSEEKTTYDIMAPEGVERIRKTDLEVFNTGNPYLGLERIELKDGRSYDTIVRKSAIEDDGKRLLLTTRWNQSLQNELKRRSKLFSLTLEAMNAFTWFYEPDKQHINFGDGFDKIGRNTSEINTLETFVTCLHPDDLQSFTQSLQTVVSGESGFWELEYRLDLNNDGTYSWWETRGILETTLLNDIPYKYMLGMTICIEPHKQAELALLKNKEELDNLIRQNELILNNTNSGLAYITTDYMVQWENVSLCSRSLSFEAYKRGELCYKSAHNRVSPCEDCVMQRAMFSRQTEKKQFLLDNNHVVEIYATPVFRESGEVDGIVIRVDDVTERQRMIEELKQAKTLAEQSDKLKSAFLANMSHEIRTPLNAIVGFSELLADTIGEEEKTEYVNIINTNNELLLKLINDILDLSKIEAGTVEFVFEEFDLADYFDTIVSSMRQRVSSPNVRLIACNPYRTCKVKLDKNRVAQVMTNYVTNAIKYTPKGFIEMGYECTAAGIRFYVKDTGIGITDEKKERVFHRFAKLDEFAQGTGLGLSICKAIAESMGGSVGFESKNEEGSLFWVFLPCKPEIGQVDNGSEMNLINENGDFPLKTNVRLQTGTMNRKTILIAEDIQSNFLLLSAILKKEYVVLHAADGQQAVEMVRKHAVDLLFMDMKMPVMNGLEATGEIRKFDKKLPIVALTAHAFETDRLAALTAGCNEFLVKPIDKVRLMAVLQKYCPDKMY